MTNYRDSTPNNFPDDYDESQVDPRVLLRTKAVREKMYGGDTRDAMAQAEEITSVVSVEAKEIAENTEVRQTDLENRYEDQLAGNTDVSEVIDARRPTGGDVYPTLNQRLDEQIGKDAEFRAFEKVSFLKRINNELSERALNPLWFGAKGDGETDDGLAIKACHEYANEHGYVVEYPKGYSFLISETSEIPIETNTDTRGAKLIINDDPSTVNRNLPVFVVPDFPSTTHTNDEVTEEIASLIHRGYHGQIPILASGQRRFVEIFDDNDLIIERYGDYQGSAPKPRQDIFRIDSSGYVMDDILYDFNGVTRAVVHEVPLNPLILQVGEVETFGKNIRTQGNYFERNFHIRRSNVIVNGLAYKDIDDSPTKQSRRGIIKTEHCCQVWINGFNAVPSLSQGSYLISNHSTLDLFFNGVRCDGGQEDRWRCHASYMCKKVTVFNSEMNGFDAHDPISYVYFLRSKIGYRGISITGWGDLVIKDVEFHSQSPIHFRGDYGSTWNGNIYVDNVTHIPLGASFARFFVVSPQVDHDFGIPTTLGKDFVRINGLYVKDRNQSIARYSIFQIDCGTDNPITPARDYFKICPEISIKDVTRDGFSAESNERGVLPFWIRGFRNLRAHRDGYFNQNSNGTIDIDENIGINLTNVNLDNSNPFAPSDSDRVSNLFRPLPSTVFNYSVAKDYSDDFLIPKFKIKSCTNVFASLKGLKGIIEAEDSTIRTAVNTLGGGTQSKTKFEGCKIEPYFDRDADFKSSIRGSRLLTKFINCEFLLPIHQLGRVSADSTHVLMVYELFANITNAANIAIGAELLSCSFGRGMDLSLFNTNLHLFTQDIGTTSKSILLRRIGPSATRPTVGLYPGFVYFDTDLNVLRTWDGTQWRQ